MHTGRRGQFVYLCIKRGTAMSANTHKSTPKPISHVIVLLPERGEVPPRGYTLIQRKGQPANLNTGTLGEKVFLAVFRSQRSIVTDVQIIFPKKGEITPSGYDRVDLTPSGYSAECNSSRGPGTQVYICYRQQIQVVESLVSRVASQGDVKESRDEVVFYEEDESICRVAGSSSSSSRHSHIPRRRRRQPLDAHVSPGNGYIHRVSYIQVIFVYYSDHIHLHYIHENEIRFA